MLSDHFSLDDLFEDQDCYLRILENETEVVHDAIASAFVENYHTQQITKVDWNRGSTMRIFTTCALPNLASDVNVAVRSNQGQGEVGNYKRVTVSMVSLRWLFQGGMNFQHFANKLKLTGQERYLNNDLFMAMYENYWAEA